MDLSQDHLTQGSVRDMIDFTTLRGRPFRQLLLLITLTLIALVTVHFINTWTQAVSVLHDRGKVVKIYEFERSSRLLNDPEYWAQQKETAQNSVLMALDIETATPTITPTLTPSPTPTFTATSTNTSTPTSTSTPTQTPTPTVTPLPGTTRVSPVDGMVSIFIPAGEFLMGVPVRDGEITGDDQPEHAVYVDAFWLDRTQVTNAMYALCLNAGKCDPPIRQEINPHYYDPAFANHPVVYIAWSLAEQYCVWSGGSLPTEAQWERAATGDGVRLYAWGEDDPSPDLVTSNNYFDTTTEVGSHPAGASPFGVLDMGGNVREWVADWFGPDYFSHSPYANPKGPDSGEYKVLKGASWHDDEAYSRATSRYKHDPNSAGNNRGFRCAYP
jgi:formylglycine-generating enzyme required for sulfatase activity